MPEPEEAQPGAGEGVGERRPGQRLGARGKLLAVAAGIGLAIALAGGGVAMAVQDGTDSNTETDSDTETESGTEGTQEGPAEDCPDEPGDSPGPGRELGGGDGPGEVWVTAADITSSPDRERCAPVSPSESPATEA